jgi:hypothetical protein
MREIVPVLFGHKIVGGGIETSATILPLFYIVAAAFPTVSSYADLPSASNMTLIWDRPAHADTRSPSSN